MESYPSSGLYKAPYFCESYFNNCHVFPQHEIQQGIACVFYVEQLVRHAQPELKEKRPKKKLLENLQNLGKVLRDLEVDLRTNPNDS